MTKHIFDCIDAHTCGNPVRLILSKKPDLAGSSMSQKRSDFIKNFDWIRKSLMFEPRGHDIMSGGMIFPPNDPNNDFSILFLETSGCLPMCGHGTPTPCQSCGFHVAQRAVCAHTSINHAIV